MDIKSFLTGKCRFADTCKLYDKTSSTCNRTSGKYYGTDRYAGCYRDMEK